MDENYDYWEGRARKAEAQVEELKKIVSKAIGVGAKSLYKEDERN